jgi:hypothetical protein
MDGVYCDKSQRNAHYAIDQPIIHHALYFSNQTARRVAHIYMESKCHLSATYCLQIHGYGDRGDLQK